MKKTTLLSLILVFASYLAIGQCTISSANGYQVNVSLNPTAIVPSSMSCSGGYNYNVAIDYDISFSGSNIPASLYTLQGNITCRGAQSSFTGLPNSGGTGTAISGGNQWNPNNDCATATPTSLNCSSFNLQIQGPGLPNQNVNCPFNTTLPIELARFELEKTYNSEVNVKWSTALEENNDFFTIEKSKEGREWEEVTEIKGQGNSSALLNYEIRDENPFQGLSYYRIRQTDYDGKSKVSRIMSVNFNEIKAFEVSMYPNPATDKVYLKGDKSELQTIEIYDIFGKNVTSIINTDGLKDNNAVLDVSNLVNGTYYVKTKTTVHKLSKR